MVLEILVAFEWILSLLVPLIMLSPLKDSLVLDIFNSDEVCFSRANILLNNLCVVAAYGHCTDSLARVLRQS